MLLCERVSKIVYLKQRYNKKQQEKNATIILLPSWLLVFCLPLHFFSLQLYAVGQLITEEECCFRKVKWVAKSLAMHNWKNKLA